MLVAPSSAQDVDGLWYFNYCRVAALLFDTDFFCEYYKSANDRRKYNCANDHRKYNCANDHRKYNCANDYRKYNCANDHRKYNCANDYRKYNCANDHGKFNCANDHRKYNCANDRGKFNCANDQRKYNYSANEHRKYNYSANEHRKYNYSANEHRKYNYSANEHRKYNYSANEHRKYNYSANEHRKYNYSANDHNYVDNYNSKVPPVNFVNISMVVALSIMETQNKVLDAIVCEDINNDKVKVSLVSVEPRNAKCAMCFQVLQCAPGWCLKFIPNVGQLDIKTDPVYKLSITCQNSKGATINWLTEVRLTTNSPPQFNYSLVTHTVPNTRNVKSGDVIYSVLATDVDGDVLRYSMATNPDNGNFQIGEFDGVIRAAADLSRECSQSVRFEVFVRDGINNQVGPCIINTVLDDAIKAPSILNMGHMIQVREDKAPMDNIYTIDVDGDPHSTVSYTLTTSPNQAYPFFSFSNYDIVLASALDYENPIGGYKMITLTVTAVDKGGCTSDAKSLVIEVVDVNEPPRLVPDVTAKTEYEGKISIIPMWKVEDPDKHDFAIFSITNSNGDFAIDPFSGEITSIGDYDVDGKPMPHVVTLNILVEDRFGLGASGTVTINILDTNDNPPVITNLSVPFEATECTAVGSSLGVIKAQDADSSFQGNNDVYFLIQSSRYFTVIPTGHVILSSPIQAGDYSSATVYASDRGQYPGPLKSTPAFIIVRGIPCPTTTSTTTSTSTTTTPTTRTTLTSTQVTTTLISVVENDITANLPWIVIAVILGTCFVGLLTFFCCKFNRVSCSKTGPPKVRFTEPLIVKSATPPAIQAAPSTESLPKQSSPFIVGSQPPQKFDFWSGRFADNIPN